MNHDIHGQDDQVREWSEKGCKYIYIYTVKENLNPRKQFKSKDGNELWISIGFKETWYIGIVYITPTDNDYRTRIQNLQQNVLRFMASGKVIIMGDFNARVGEFPNILTQDSNEENRSYSRTSLDKFTNAREKFIVESFNAVNVVLLNGILLSIPVIKRLETSPLILYGLWKGTCITSRI